MKEEITIEYECICCFVVETQDEEMDKATYMCELCKERPSLMHDQKAQLERRLDVLSRTALSNFPKVIRQMYEVLKERKDD